MSEPLRLLNPQIGIVTTIGGDHYTAFRTLEATALEKGKLVEGLPPEGTAIPMPTTEPELSTALVR